IKSKIRIKIRTRIRSKIKSKTGATIAGGRCRGPVLLLLLILVLILLLLFLLLFFFAYQSLLSSSCFSAPLVGSLFVFVLFQFHQVSILESVASLDHEQGVLDGDRLLLVGLQPDDFHAAFIAVADAEPGAEPAGLALLLIFAVLVLDRL